MFGGQGGGGSNPPPPYPFGQLPNTTAGSSGQPATLVPAASMFGMTSTSSGDSIGQSASSVVYSTQAGSLFGQAGPGSSSSFGQQPTAGSGMFGKQPVSSMPVFGQLAASGFGTPAIHTGAAHESMTSTGTVRSFDQGPVSTSAVFGQGGALASPVFGQGTSAPSAVFGQMTSTASPGFGQGTTAPAAVFGQTTTATPVFGQGTTAPSAMFGQTESGASPQFGQGATAPSTLFGQTTSTTSPVFGQKTTTPSAMFGQTTSATSSVFGEGTTAPSAVFGQTTSTTSPVFGRGTTVPSAVFGQTTSTTSPVFGEGTTAPSAVFGQPTSNASPVFGRGTTAPSAVFGQMTSTSSPVFGRGTTAPSALFGRHLTSSSGGTEPPGAPVTVSTHQSTTVTQSLFGANSATVSSSGFTPSSSLFGKKQDGGGELFGKQKPVAAEQGEPADQAAGSLFSEARGAMGTSRESNTAVADTEESAAPTSALFGKASKPQASGLFGRSQAASEADTGAGSAAASDPAGGRAPVRSVFARPGGDAPRKRLTSTTGGLAEASRRTLARTGLVRKQAESPTANKSLGAGSAGPRLQRLSSAEQLQEVTSLLCTEVPEGYNERTILSRHFAKFGHVLKVTCNKAKNTASVHFADHAAADAARKRGMKVHPKLPPMSLYFRRPVKAGSVPAARRPPPPSDDVSDELLAMAGTSRESPTEQKPRRPAAPAAAAPPVATAPPAAEHTPAAAAAATSTATLNVSELRVLLRQPATTASERYRVLDARDKLHRAARRREQAGRSGPLVGTCPDMCPEKERYMREEKHQISSIYEKDRDRKGGFEMDHCLAVKQYSRSSADQEEPLPHDLRTPAALLTTMDYLVTHVTDCDTRDTGDWFHFIWDRTRGIRKDITQQQLTNDISVGLVEKCARFHVHCAAALCELSRDMFDQKINNENLTKCLQTLKHMYHDLSLKGIQCPCEAEFRAYDILLNLNQGDILREVQTYSDSVRDSPEVQSALKVYVAISTNNYVRFFKLVRGAGYLSACLLQRYFNQVRTRALDIITRTFCPPKKVVEFPLTELQHTLGFESEQECASVLRQHGLESEEGTAFLERVMFQTPETPPELRRCRTLIDDKLNTTVGEVINGSALPADPLLSYRPHNSFDDTGVLRRDAWDAHDQCDPSAETAAEPPAAPPAEWAAAAAAAAAAGDVLTEVVSEEVRRLSDHVLSTAGLLQRLAGEMYQDVVGDVVSHAVREVCTGELAEARRQQERQRQLAEERLLAQQQQQAKLRRDQQLKERLSTTLTETLIAEVCLDQTSDIALEEMNTVQAINSVLAEVHQSLWADGADRLVREMALQVIADCRRQRHTLTQALTQIGRRLTLRRLVARWRQSAEAGRRLRAEQSRFPAGRPLHGAQVALQLLGGPRQPPHPPADRRADQSLCSLLLSDRLFSQPVSLAAVLSPLASALSGHVLWKLAVAAPPACPLTEWLLHKLSDDQHRPNDVLQLSSVSASRRCRLSLCARAMRGRPDEAVGSAGLALAFSGPATAARLRALLSELPREPLLPLAVLTTPGHHQQALDQLHLPDRLRHGAITTYRVFQLEPDDAVQMGETLVAMLEWLFNHRPSPPPLRAGVIRHVAEDFFSEHVTSRMYSDMQLRRSKKRVEQSPTASISLYNAAVRHLAAVLSSSSLPDLSWPPAELTEDEEVPPAGWNRPARLLQLQQSVEELSLPCLELDPDGSWSDGCVEVLQYVRDLLEPGYDSAPTLYRVQSLLRERLQQLRKSAWPLDDDVTSQPLGASMPWTDIVQCCIELRTSRLSSTEVVYFLPDEMANFRVPDVWVDFSSMSRTRECLTLDESVAIAKRPLDTSVEESSNKRRPERSSLPCPTLDVSRDILRELNVSLDWENRLKELVDQGDKRPYLAGPLTPPKRRAAALLSSSRETATSPLPASSRRTAGSPLSARPPSSVEQCLDELRAGLAADRRLSDDFSRRLLAAGAELATAGAGGEPC